MYKPNTIIIEEAVYREKVAERITNRLGKECNKVVQKTAPISQPSGNEKILFLAEQKGRFLRHCPCSPGVISCGYHILDIGMNCIYGCHYCFLKTYSDSHNVTLYINHSKAIDEVRDFLNSSNNNFCRIGSGEFTDSLALDHLTDFSLEIMELFADHPRAQLELKTKSTNIRHILAHGTPKNRNIVLAWTLNCDTMAATLESDCPSVQERIAAAKDAVKQGFPVAFHFDPIVVHDGWMENYEKTICFLFQNIDSSAVKWISMGALRFTSAMRQLHLEDKTDGKIFWNEFVPCPDGKLRYPKKLRLTVFKHILMLLRQYRKSRFPIYLCMETKETWRKVFAF